MYVGFGAALAGIFSTLVNFTWWPTQGFGFLLLALAAVFVGGTPTWGGVGTIIGAVFGVGVIAYMEVGVVAIGMSGVWRQFFNGLIIILAILGHRFHGMRIR
jgi:simple sugar transport system permease protein